MDGAYLIEFIKQRMRDLGYSDYTFTAVRFYPTAVGGNARLNYIDAYNEHYFLVSKTVPSDIQIVSDTNVFDEGAFYADFNFYNIQEFTGRIKIISPTTDIDLEFIQVIPRIPRIQNTDSPKN